MGDATLHGVLNMGLKIPTLWEFMNTLLVIAVVAFYGICLCIGFTRDNVLHGIVWLGVSSVVCLYAFFQVLFWRQLY